MQTLNLLKPLKVGLLGLGIVGTGTIEVLRRNQVEIARRAGREIIITHATARDVTKPRGTSLDGITVVTDPQIIINHSEIDVVCELIGGDTFTKTLVLQAIAAGKHVVTANKALLAKYGTEIFAAAEAKGVSVSFEAAVAGGVPIIKALREGVAANKVEWIAGIINGTSNFILSEMRDKGANFADVLAQAQALGYAEADPTFDIEGVDAAHKLTILAAIGFGVPVQFDRAFTEGISKLTDTDIKYAEQLGYRIKLIGFARRTAEGIELRVHPTLIPTQRLIANVEGVMNAVMVKGDAMGVSLYYGRGAGSEPTASAVVADLVDVARMLGANAANRVPHLAFRQMDNTPILPMEKVVTANYLRLSAFDKPGVMANVTRILAENSISISAMLQKEAKAGENVADVVIITHRCVEADANRAIKAIEALETIAQKVVRIRLEDLV